MRPRDESIHATVVVCTHNRAERLGSSVEAMLRCDLAAPRWELILVDSASTDATPQVVSTLVARAPDRTRSLRLERPGLSVARNAGVTEARGDVVVFFDDDCQPAPAALGLLVEALGSPQVEVAGGPVVPVFEGELPPWFLGRYLPFLTAWDRGAEPHELHYNEYPRGTNIAFRRSAIERCGGFGKHLGRTGSKLTSGEELELCLRIERTGGRIVYVPDAVVYHAVSLARLSPAWMVKRFAAQGHCEAMIDWQHHGWSGVRAGLRRAYSGWRGVPPGERIEQRILRHCHRAALTAYLTAIPRALVTVRRYAH